MPLQKFKQFVRETSVSPDPQDNAPRTFPMTLQDLIDSLESFDDKDRAVDVSLDSSEADEIFRVKFAQATETLIQNDKADCPDTPKDQREPRITRFSWSMVELRQELGYFSDNYMVDITLNSAQPGKIWMVFKKGEDSYYD